MQTNEQLQFAGELQQHKNLIYNVINTYCYDENYKDDLYQDIALRAWNAYEDYTGASKFSTWLHAIARNTAVDRIRRLNTQIKTILTDNILWEIEDVPYSEEIPNINYSVISTLSEAEKRTLQMRIDGLTFSEISKQTGEPLTRLIVRMHRIKTLLTEGVRRKYVSVAERKQRQLNKLKSKT